MSNLTEIKGIGSKSLAHLHANGIFSTNDLVRTYPSKYTLHQIERLEDAFFEKDITLEMTLIDRPRVHYIRRRLTKMILKAKIGDRTFEVSIFNREFLKGNLFEGDLLVVSGRMQSNSRFLANDIVKRERYVEGIIPEYHLENISSKLFSKWVSYALDQNMCGISETIPLQLLEKNKLDGSEAFFRIVHRPKTMDEVKRSENRIKYEELLHFFIRLELMKERHRSARVEAKHYDIAKVREFIETLPFELTDDQKSATNEIFRDLKKDQQMNRLLQGDTGSGKTVCAAIAIYAVATAKQQTALMAPTEILAHQHERTIRNYLEPFGLRICFLSSSVTGAKRKEILEGLRTGGIDVVVGTHSLIQENVEFHRLGFVVIDEQHRFGVAQRKALREKGLNPDVLFMSATPIPRTLAITIFKDMDISSIRTMPSGRIPVRTKIIEFETLDRSFSVLEKELLKGHQGYVIVPLIQEKDDSPFLSIEEAERIVKDALPGGTTLGILHGKMKNEEKEAVLLAFRENRVSVLVSTTVVEVGVNVVNATFMMVLNADRFGLSQLHQLRGRVGRSNHQAYCHLITDGMPEEESRLEILERTTDGFEISEADLKFRGPGQIFGSEQTGIPRFRFANFITDRELIESALEDAGSILTMDDPLAALLRKKTGNALDTYHLD